MKAKQVLLAILFLSCIDAAGQPAGRMLHFWSVGNADYPAGSIFTSYAGINYSADALAKLKFWASGRQQLRSGKGKQLTSAAMLRFIGQNIRALPARAGLSHTIIIYYCGHGVADLSGGAYWVPGNTLTTPRDTSFEYLSKKLLNIDRIIQLVNAEQAAFPGRTRFLILSDCCSDRVASKWYSGINFQFSGHQDAVISYGPGFLAKKDSLNSALSASANLTFDDLGKTMPSLTLAQKPSINEFAFIPEMIRFNTFTANGNLLVYSSKLGEETAMVDSPDPLRSAYQIGPVARRVLLYAWKEEVFDVKRLIAFITGPGDKDLTQPAVVNRNRN
jgi:hypothetical protein